MTDTALDAAHAAMQADVNDDAARLRFYEILVGSEVFLLLKSEPEGDQISPEVFELTDNSFVLVFDTEDRLTTFTGKASPYGAMSGRAICQMLSTNTLGIGLNLDVAPSSILIPPEAVMWLANLQTTPDQIEAKVKSFNVPKGLPAEFLTSLDARLASATGLASSAYLVGVTYENGGTGHLLGFINALPVAQSALAQTVSQALVFSGLDAATIDVGFFQASDPAAAKMAIHGLRFDLPQILAPVRVAPGSDPKKPPILK